MILKQKGERVCCAESCTGGMITAALTEIPGSSSVLSRGFVTYSNQSKIDMLGVKLKTLELHGAVSGVAGPDGGNKEKPVGLVYICILKKGDVGEIKKYIFRGDRQSVRYQTVIKALDNLTQLV